MGMSGGGMGEEGVGEVKGGEGFRLMGWGEGEEDRYNRYDKGFDGVNVVIKDVLEK